jgi:hypothetical protein
MLDSGQGGVREALAVDNRERKGASALSISYNRVAYKQDDKGLSSSIERIPSR